MKRLSLFILTLSSVFSHAEEENQLPLGIEAVTGFRSEYVYRGFQHAQQVLDFQLEGEVTLKDGYYLGYGAWYGTGTGSDDFSETGLKISLTYDIDEWQWYNSIKYRDLNESEFDSGVEFTSQLTYFLSESAKHSREISGIVSYDSGAEGLYGAVEFVTYQAVSDDAFITFKTGASFTDDYYQTSGANDIYSRISFTYNISKQVSVTPFAFGSLNLANDGRSDYIGAGLWFEMSF